MVPAKDDIMNMNPCFAQTIYIRGNKQFKKTRGLFIFILIPCAPRLNANKSQKSRMLNIKTRNTLKFSLNCTIRSTNLKGAQLLFLANNRFCFPIISIFVCLLFAKRNSLLMEQCSLLILSLMLK